MPISFSFDGDDVVWTQRFVRPAIYMDTFAIREIAESDELSSRFAQGIKARNGTWLLGSLSTGEFARFADRRHADKAEQLLAQVLPHIYLHIAESDRARAERGEVDLANRTVPKADPRHMDYFSQRWAHTQDIQETFRGMFQMVHQNRDDMREILDEVASELIASLTKHRQLDAYRKNAKAARPDDGRTRQQIISGELMRERVLDTNAPFTANDAVDLMHAADAVDYCDLVLLDKAWERRVRALHQRIDQCAITMPIARCFSKRNGGVVTFLEAIEQWPECG